MPEPDVRILNQRFEDHCEQNTEGFERINDVLTKLDEKLDKVVLGVARLEFVEEASKEKEVKAGKRTAQVWAAFVAILVVALDKIIARLF